MQGNLSGMCISHYNSQCDAIGTVQVTKQSDALVEMKGTPPQIESVYKNVLPNSLTWKPHSAEDGVMPLAAHLRAGHDLGKPPAWHRNEEH